MCVEYCDRYRRWFVLPDGTRECRPVREGRLGKTPEGRKELMADYRDELAAASAALEGRPRPVDVLHRLQAMGVPGTALLALRGLQDRPALAAAKQWVEIWGTPEKSLFPALVLAGPTGVGKSVAAAWCLQEFARNYDWNGQPSGPARTPAVWLDASELAGVTDWKDQDRLEELRMARVLVIDDAGREGTPAGRERLSELIRVRVDHCRRTALATNAKGETFRERYGVVLADRLRSVAIAPNLSAEKSMRTPKHPPTPRP